MDDYRQRYIAEFTFKGVDENSPIPLYHQIEANLRELIKTGQFAPNDLLPPEIELSEAYKVGRHTVRQALARLAADNLIVRKAGRGTAVIVPSHRTTFYLDRSFTSQMAEMGRRAHSTVLDQSEGLIVVGMAEVLRKKVGSPYLRLTRLRFGDDEPIGLQDATVLTERCTDLRRYDFSEKSLYDVLARVYQLAITEIVHTISAVAADDQQASLLHVQRGDPLLLVKSDAYLADQEIIEHSISYYRADMYEYSTTHTFSR